MTSVAMQLLGALLSVILMLVVGILTLGVQRKFGSKWLWVVWLAPAFIVTGLLLTQLDYNVHPMTSRPVLSAAMSWFVLVSLFSGATVWHTLVWFGPRSPSAASNGISDRPLAGPAAWRDAHGLPGILGRYEKLLATYETSLNAAPIHPYPSLPRVFLRVLRGFSPSATRQSMQRVRQMGQLPNALARQLTGAEDVLAELETLTTAQFSAIEECHRINVRRLRLGLIYELLRQSRLPLFVSGLITLVLAAEKAGVLKLSDLWPLIGGITMMGADIPSMFFRGVIGGLSIFLFLLICEITYSVPRRQRLQAFEDILTIAKTYRKVQGEMTKPSVEQSLAATG